MTPVSKGSSYGEPGGLPVDGVIVRSDGEARAVVEPALRARRRLPVLGLLGGDLCRTLGGPTDEARLRSPEAMRFPVDVGEVLLDGRLHFFVAHLVVRSRGWGIALKVVDGNPRGLHPATVAVLDLLGLVNAEQRQALANWREPVIRNYRGLATGRVESTVLLERRS